MGENPGDMPTMADYAYHEARQSREDAISLIKRVAHLEQVVAQLQKMMTDHISHAGAPAS